MGSCISSSKKDKRKDRDSRSRSYSSTRRSRRSRSKYDSSTRTSRSGRKSKSKTSRSRTRYTSSESENKNKKYKFLFVGPGEAGKSTFFKIVTKETSGMFTTKSDMLDFNDSIIENLFELLRTVLKMCYELGEYTDEDGNYYDCRISEELEADVQIIFSFHSILIDSDTLKSIKRLIKDDGFITVSKQLRHLYHVSDGCDYFLEHLDRIADEKYVPTFTDIKYCRDRTIGVTHEEVSYEFHGKQIDIDIFDVGGQRAERKAWQNVFANTSALYFFVAISEYAMKCIEDDVTNRICEALSVLRILSEAPVFATTPMLIVVTKSDQLKAKLDEGEKFHLEPPESGIASFEPYRGDNTLEDIQQYIEDICRAQVKGDKKVIVVFKNLLDDNVTFRDEFDQLLDAVEALKA